MSTMSFRGAKRRGNLRGSVILNFPLVILYVIDGLSLISVVLRIEAEDLLVNRYGFMKNFNILHVITRSEATW